MEKSGNLVISAVLLGVDFTKRGEYTNDNGEVIKYNDSIKLKVNISFPTIKDGIKINAIRQQTLKPPIQKSLEDDVAYYNTMVGKNIIADLIPREGAVYPCENVRLGSLK